jgi:hypothetical protein
MCFELCYKNFVEVFIFKQLEIEDKLTFICLITKKNRKKYISGENNIYCYVKLCFGNHNFSQDKTLFRFVMILHL